MQFDMNNRNHMLAAAAVVLAVLAFVLVPYLPLPSSGKAQKISDAPQEPNFNVQPSQPGCPVNSCRNWISGSCSAGKLYKERECYRYGPAPGCKQEIYYESYYEEVKACG